MRGAIVGLGSVAVVLAVSALNYEPNCTAAAIAGTYEIKTSKHHYRLSLYHTGKGELVVMPSTRTSFTWELEGETQHISLHIERAVRDILFAITREKSPLAAQNHIATNNYETSNFGLDPKCSVTGVNKIYLSHDEDIYFLRN